MDSIKKALAQNIIKLRLKNEMTQNDLAKKLNYTDKSVSKWENCESTPPIEVIKAIADVFEVSVDYLITANIDNYDKKHNAKQNNTNKLIISLLSLSLVWIIATLVYSYMASLTPIIERNWLVFVGAIPMSSVVLLVFNSIWGNRKFNYIIISVGIWSLLVTIYLLIENVNNFWSIFLIGIPLQIATILWSKLKFNTHQ